MERSDRRLIPTTLRRSGGAKGRPANVDNPFIRHPVVCLFFFFLSFFASALQISTTLFSPFFVPRTLSKGKIRSRSRVVEQLVRARKRFIATTRRMASAQTFLIDKSIYVWREKLRENKEGGRVQVETLAGIALPRGLFRPCFAARAARDSCGPTDSPPTREREIRIYICKGRGRETNSAARPLFTEKRLLHTSPYTSR